MQTSIFLPLILMAGTGGDGADAASIVTRANAQTDAGASTMVSTTVSSPANIMHNSHFRSQSGFQNGAQSGVETGIQSGRQSSIGPSIGPSIRANAVLQEIFEGCSPAVLDPRLSSRILFDDRLALLEAEYGGSAATSKDQIFISRCGDEFVLFSRVSASAQDALYLRFQDGTYELVDQHWG